MSLVDRFLSTFSRHTHRSRAAVRAETLPPLPRSSTGTWRRRLGAWLASGLSDGDHGSEMPAWSAAALRPSGLEAARAAFCAALQDVDPQRARACLEQIGQARSLHELWHLRSPVYSLVSHRHAQGEANQRMAALDQLFSKRQRRRATLPLRPRR